MVAFFSNFRMQRNGLYQYSIHSNRVQHWPSFLSVTAPIFDIASFESSQGKTFEAPGGGERERERKRAKKDTFFVANEGKNVTLHARKRLIVQNASGYCNEITLHSTMDVTRARSFRSEMVFASFSSPFFFSNEIHFTVSRLFFFIELSSLGKKKLSRASHK